MCLNTRYWYNNCIPLSLLLTFCLFHAEQNSFCYEAQNVALFNDAFETCSLRITVKPNIMQLVSSQNPLKNIIYYLIRTPDVTHKKTHKAVLSR